MPVGCSRPTPRSRRRTAAACGRTGPTGTAALRRRRGSSICRAPRGPLEPADAVPEPVPNPRGPSTPTGRPLSAVQPQRPKPLTPSPSQSSVPSRPSRSVSRLGFAMKSITKAPPSSPRDRRIAPAAPSPSHANTPATASHAEPASPTSPVHSQPATPVTAPTRRSPAATAAGQAEIHDHARFPPARAFPRPRCRPRRSRPMPVADDEIASRTCSRPTDPVDDVAAEPLRALTEVATPARSCAPVASDAAPETVPTAPRRHPRPPRRRQMPCRRPPRRRRTRCRRCLPRPPTKSPRRRGSSAGPTWSDACAAPSRDGGVAERDCIRSRFSGVMPWPGAGDSAGRARRLVGALRLGGSLARVHALMVV